MSTSTGRELLAVGQVDQVTDGAAVAGEQMGGGPTTADRGRADWRRTLSGRRKLPA